MSLPKFLVMKSNESGKYLCYGKGKGSTLSSLTFSHQMSRPNLDDATYLESLKKKEESTMTISEKLPMEFNLLKFEVKEAKNTPGFVHIRTSYNKKYLVRKSEESMSLVAEAQEAEEDQSKWSCTLFKPIFCGEADDDNEEGDYLFGNKHGIGMTPRKIQLVHAMSQYYVYIDTETESMELTSATTTPSTLTVSDVEHTAQLPNRLAFRGSDGKYLGSPNQKDLWFWYTDLGSAEVAMSSSPDAYDPANTVALSSGYYYFWKVNENLDVGLFDYTRTPIYPVKFDNCVALYSADNNRYLWRTGYDSLKADSTTIVKEARLEVVEPVLSRTILSITYDLDNARVYGTTDVTKISDSRSNYTDEKETGSLSRNFTTSRAMSWNQSITVSVGMSMSMKFGIPEVGIGGEVSLNFDISETCEWGEELTNSETITHAYNFDIPPHTKQTKKVVASKSSCYVPFTCEVEDMMTDGTIHKYTKTDCWFSGANDYNITEETRNENLIT